MRAIKNILKWIWKAWPIIIILPCLIIHYELIHYFEPYADTIHKTIALIVQIVGGLLVLYSIDSNIGIIKDKKLTALFTDYLKSFPLIKKSYVIEAKSGAMSVTGLDAKLKVIRKPKTIEDKLNYLQEQIDSLEKTIDKKAEALDSKIKNISEKLNADVSETKKAIEHIETQIEQVSIGGFKSQLFGLLLLLYGAITSYIT